MYVLVLVTIIHLSYSYSRDFFEFITFSFFFELLDFEVFEGKSRPCSGRTFMVSMEKMAHSKTILYRGVLCKSVYVLGMLFYGFVGLDQIF